MSRNSQIVDRSDKQWKKRVYTPEELLSDISNELPLVAAKIRAELDTRNYAKLVFFQRGSERFEEILEDLAKAANEADREGKKTFSYNTRAVPGKENLFKGSKSVDLSVKAVKDIGTGDANFVKIKGIFSAVMPGLGKFWDLGHVDYSNLQSKIAILLANWEKDDPRRPAMRALSILVKQADADIHRNTDNPPTSVMDLILETAAILEVPYDVTQIWEPLYNADKLKGVVTVTYEPSIENKRRGASLSKELGALVAQVEKGLFEKIERKLKKGGIDVANLTGSPTLTQAAEIILTTTLDPKARPVRKVKTSKHTNKTRTKKPKGSSKSATKARKVAQETKKKADKIKFARKDGKQDVSPLMLASLIQRKIAARLRENMIAPSLVWRTGRFANSVKVTSIVDGIIEYTYMKNPYEVFEMGSGSRLATPARDPRSIIDMSVRQIATELVRGRFTTRRV